MPDFVPGPRMVVGRSLNQREAMRRNCVVTAGADDEMASAVTVVRRSSPSRSSSWVSMMACSSGVRSVMVDMRQ